MNGKFCQFPPLATVSTDNPSTDLPSYITAVEGYMKAQSEYVPQNLRKFLTA